jgi:hypothetical protein
MQLLPAGAPGGTLVCCSCNGEVLAELSEAELADGLAERVHGWHRGLRDGAVLCPVREAGWTDGHVCLLPYGHAGDHHYRQESAR